MADVKAEEEVHVITSTKMFALENWGEWHFLPDIDIIYCFGFSAMGDHTDTHMFIAIVSYYFTLTYKWSNDVPFCFLGEFCIFSSKYSVTLISTGYF